MDSGGMQNTALKPCPRCKVNPKGSSGYCNACHSATMREWRKGRPLTPDQRRKDSARSYANTYLRRGLLQRQPCRECGAANAEMHHPDYAKPIDVIWLCRECHLALHAAERRAVKRETLGLTTMRHTPEDSILIERWLRRHQGPRRVAAGTSGEVRRADRRPEARACRIGGDWYAVRTTIKGERVALKELERSGFEAYLPAFNVERINKRLKVKFVSTQCIFPRYLFVRMRPEDLSVVRGQDGVEDVLPGYPVAPQPILGKDAKDLLDLRDRQRRHLLDDTEQGRRVRGETAVSTLAALRKRLGNRKVKVLEGPFLGFTGDVEIVHSIDRLRVLISIFGRPTAVELEMGQVEEAA